MQLLTLDHQNQWKMADHFLVWPISCYHSSKPPKKHLIPICEIKEKKNKNDWTKECQRSFEHTKNLLITLPVLCMPTDSDKCMLQNDTSKTATGSVLFKF